MKSATKNVLTLNKIIVEMITAENNDTLPERVRKADSDPLDESEGAFFSPHYPYSAKTSFVFKTWSEISKSEFEWSEKHKYIDWRSYPQTKPGTYVVVSSPKDKQRERRTEIVARLRAEEAKRTTTINSLARDMSKEEVSEFTKLIRAGIQDSGIAKKFLFARNMAKTNVHDSDWVDSDDFVDIIGDVWESVLRDNLEKRFIYLRARSRAKDWIDKQEVGEEYRPPDGSFVSRYERYSSASENDPETGYEETTETQAAAYRADCDALYPRKELSYEIVDILKRMGKDSPSDLIFWCDYEKELLEKTPAERKRMQRIRKRIRAMLTAKPAIGQKIEPADNDYPTAPAYHREWEDYAGPGKRWHRGPKVDFTQVNYISRSGQESKQLAPTDLCATVHWDRNRLLVERRTITVNDVVFVYDRVYFLGRPEQTAEQLVVIQEQITETLLKFAAHIADERRWLCSCERQRLTDGYLQRLTWTPLRPLVWHDHTEWRTGSTSFWPWPHPPVGSFCLWPWVEPQ